MNGPASPFAVAADRLAQLYGETFGGKRTGRYRMPIKLVRQLTGRRRLYEEDMRVLGREMFERGFVLIDMESFVVVMAASSFVNYRRANEERIA